MSNVYTWEVLPSQSLLHRPAEKCVCVLVGFCLALELGLSGLWWLFCTVEVRNGLCLLPSQTPVCKMSPGASDLGYRLPQLLPRMASWGRNTVGYSGLATQKALLLARLLFNFSEQLTPPSSHHGQRASFAWGSESPFRPGGGSQGVGEPRARGKKPLVVSWFRLGLIESFQLELFKRWLDQFYMSSHWGRSRLGLFLYVQSEVENWGNYLQANESRLCNQPVLITGQHRPHAQSFALLWGKEDSEACVRFSLGFVFKGCLLDLPAQPTLCRSWAEPHPCGLSSGVHMAVWSVPGSFNQPLSMLCLPFSGHHPEILSQFTDVQC